MAVPAKDKNMLSNFRFRLYNVVVTPCCPRENKRTSELNKSAIPLCSPTSLVGVWIGQIALETEFIELFINKSERILVSLKVWRHEEFAEYALWQIGRVLSDTTKFINRLQNANLYKTYQHLCKYATQRLSWVGRQQTRAKQSGFVPILPSVLLVQLRTDRWLQGYHLRRTLKGAMRFGTLRSIDFNKKWYVKVPVVPRSLML